MKILITDKTAEEAIQLLKDAGHDVTYDEMDGDTLLNEIAQYDALMVRGRTKVKGEIVKAGAKGKLRVIGRAGIGVDNIDIETAAKEGIKVVNAPTGATTSVAELAIGHMLSLSRHLAKADSTMKKGEWAKKQLRGTELYGKTLGLIGCGNIGKLTAKYAQAFNMSAIGFDPFISKEDMQKAGIKKVEELEELMENADFISLHLPHTSETHYIVNKDMLSKMKPNAYLINCARGGTVDEKELYNALKNGKIAGAGIDVFENEPPKDNPLLKLDNVVLTPHIGANTNEGQIRAGTVCAEQVIKTLKGETPDFWVNK
ncbi:MAG: hydroxyacid dehydrogenase [Thermoplasmatales archaeon]|nr:MAG: hydroxyacid dehydrogenase [Thermoplasmatales archaeon]